MNAKIWIVILSLLTAAGLLFAVALLGAAPELSVSHLVSGAWPPKGTDPARVAKTEVAVVGYCLEVDDPVRPTKIRLGATPPAETGFDQPSIWIDIQPAASRPDEVRPRAWTRARGYFNPQTSRFSAHQIEAKCPSAEQAKETGQGR